MTPPSQYGGPLVDGCWSAGRTMVGSCCQKAEPPARSRMMAVT